MNDLAVECRSRFQIERMNDDDLVDLDRSLMDLERQHESGINHLECHMLVEAELKKRRIPVNRSSKGAGR